MRTRSLPEHFRDAAKRFGAPIYEGDGPTKCSPATCVNPIGGLRKAGEVERRVVEGLE